MDFFFLLLAFFVCEKQKLTEFKQNIRLMYIVIFCEFEYLSI